MTVNDSFERRCRMLGVHAWSIGVMRGDVVHLLASKEMKAWTEQHDARRWARKDPIVAYGRGTGRPLAIDRLPALPGTDPVIAEARRFYGLSDGLVIPFGDGGFATFYGVEPAALEPGVRQAELAGLAFYLALHGDFSAALRMHRSGRSVSDLAAAVLTAVRETGSIKAAARRLGLTDNATTAHVKAARKLLRQIGAIGAGTPPSLVASVAFELGIANPAVQDTPT